MNTHRNIWVKLLLCAVLFARCQGEKMEVSFPEPDKIISPGSPTAALIERTVMHDGSFDNILDHASCISLKLPVTIRIKSETIQLDIKEDIQALTNHPEKEKIRLVFPVTVVLADYSEKNIKDKKKLDELIKDCIADNDVECTDFQFPLLVYSYNRDKQLQATHTINDDKTLYSLIKNIKADDIMSFKFPFRMKPKDSDDVEINDNLQLDDHITSFDNGCDEGDDVDEPAHIHIDDFVRVLEKEKWKLTYFFDEDNGVDETLDFDGYEFDFKSNQTIQAKKTGYVFGVWDTNEKDDGRHEHGHTGEQYQLEMDWENKFTFPHLEEKWDIISFTDKKFNLRHDDSILIFEKK